MPGQPQLEAFAKVLGMLETAIFNGSSGGSASEFYTVPHPGFFISPKLTERANSKDMLIISDFVNRCFEAEMRYREKTTTVTQVYSDILTQAALPERRLTASEEADLTKYEEKLERLYDAYQKYKGRYDAANGELVAAQERGDPASEILKLKDKLSFALEEWRMYGKRADYEQTRASAAYLRSVSPKLHFSNLLEKFSDHTQTTGVDEYQATYLYPPISEWDSQYTGWARFEKVFKYSELHTFSKHTSWSGSAGGGWGLWSAKVGASGSETEEHEDSENTDIELKFDYLRVRILRPWLVSDVFSYRFWTYKEEFGFRLVSDGPDLTSPKGPQGLMPVLPTDLIVARNVTISAAFTKKERDFVNKTLEVSAKGGWGPFSAKGKYKTSTTEEDVVGTFDGTTLRINNPQIIAFMGTMLPRSPDPKPGLPWTDEAALPWEEGVLTSFLTVADGEDYLSAAEQQSSVLRDIPGWGGER